MSTFLLSSLKNKFSFEKNKADLCYADVLVEISERLQIELDNSKLSLKELQRILNIDDDYYLEGILECFEELKVKDVSDIFSVFGKVLSVIPLAQGEIAKVHKISKEIREYNFSRTDSFNNDVFLICKKNKSNYEDIALIKETNSVRTLSSSAFSLPFMDDSKTITFIRNQNITGIELCHSK